PARHGQRLQARARPAVVTHRPADHWPATGRQFSQGEHLERPQEGAPPALYGAAEVADMTRAMTVLMLVGWILWTQEWTRIATSTTTNDYQRPFATWGWKAKRGYDTEASCRAAAQTINANIKGSHVTSYF